MIYPYIDTAPFLAPVFWGMAVLLVLTVAGIGYVALRRARGRRRPRRPGPRQRLTIVPRHG